MTTEEMEKLLDESKSLLEVEQRLQSDIKTILDTQRALNTTIDKALCEIRDCHKQLREFDDKVGELLQTATKLREQAMILMAPVQDFLGMREKN